MTTMIIITICQGTRHLLDYSYQPHYVLIHTYKELQHRLCSVESL